MNLPNKLTLLRIILVPFFVLFMYLKIPYAYFYALGIFAIASITDALDGKIARARNLITNFGKAENGFYNGDNSHCIIP